MLLVGCSSTAHESRSEPVELWEVDRARIFQAAEEAMRLHAQLEISDERGRLLRGHMGPYAVKITVPADAADAEIRCSREDEWSAAAIRRRHGQQEPAVPPRAEGRLTAESCVRTLQQEIDFRLGPERGAN
jgi:hypothetical protein